jgi:hypothetical protein
MINREGIWSAAQVRLLPEKVFGVFLKIIGIKSEVKRET